MHITKTDRRSTLVLLAAGVALPVLAGCGSAAAAEQPNPLKFSDAQWHKKLTDGQYDILREAGTERAFSSPLNHEKRKGIFACAGCDNHVYASNTKFDSGTGWPSFYQPISAKAVAYSSDHKLGYERNEVHCAKCGGHLGHVFDDGPPPTGKRHCINGLVLDFHPA